MSFVTAAILVVSCYSLGPLPGLAITAAYAIIF